MTSPDHDHQPWQPPRGPLTRIIAALILAVFALATLGGLALLLLA